MYSIITLFAAFALIAISIFAFSKTKSEYFDKYLKILAVSFFLLGVVRMHFSDSFVEVVTDGADIPESLFKWSYNLSYSVLPLAVFFSTRVTRNIALYFNLPIALIGAIRFENTMYYFLAEGSNGWYTEPSFRYVFYIVELMLAISIPILMQYRTKHIFKIKDIREWAIFFTALPAMLIYAMPPYIPQSIFGYMEEIPDERFSPWHLGWLILLTLGIIAAYYVFKNRTKEEKWVMLTFLVLSQFYLSNSTFLRGFRFSRIPLQFCCVACAFYMLIVLTKSERLFNFSSMCNVSGAVVASIMTTFSEGPLKCWNVHYIYEHSMVLCFPILALALGVFPRPKKRAIKDLFIVYTSYFLFCLVLGSIINNFSTTDLYDVNYFYMFDYSEALSYLPFATFLGAIEIPIGTISLYPVLIVMVYIALFLLSLGTMGLITLGFKIADKIGSLKGENREEKDISVNVTV